MQPPPQKNSRYRARKEAATWFIFFRVLQEALHKPVVRKVRQERRFVAQRQRLS